MEDFQNNYHGKLMLSQATDVERVALQKKPTLMLRVVF